MLPVAARRVAEFVKPVPLGWIESVELAAATIVLPPEFVMAPPSVLPVLEATAVIVPPVELVTVEGRRAGRIELQPA